MLPEKLNAAIASMLAQKNKKETSIISARSLSGGSINYAYLLETSSGKYFVKYNKASAYPGMFAQEARGLEFLFSANAIRVPEVIGTGESGNNSFLLLEYIEAASQKNDFWEVFGQKLAKLHSNTAGNFGLDHDNYIGSLPQYNNTHERWTDFFREERLQVQIDLAGRSGLLSKGMLSAFERLFKKLDEIFPDVSPSLIHGDLWSGNYMVDEKGEACIIDPAVYYGSREMDIGMSRLFGGFSGRFYEAYNAACPMAPGWQQRLDICNLYPLMVHVNLFGGGYVGSVEAILRRFK